MSYLNANRECNVVCVLVEVGGLDRQVETYENLYFFGFTLLCEIVLTTCQEVFKCYLL